MSAKPKASDLEALIGNFATKIESLKEEQDKVEKETEKAREEGTITEFLTNNPITTYNKIEDTLTSALEILDTAKLFINSTPDAEAFSATASLISSVQGLFQEFTDIWKRQIEWRNAINMENLKFQHKLKLEDHKHELKLKYFNETNSISTDDNTGSKMVPFNTNDFIASIRAKKNKVIDVD